MYTFQRQVAQLAMICFYIKGLQSGIAGLLEN